MTTNVHFELCHSIETLYEFGRPVDDTGDVELFADEIEAEQGQCKEVEGVTESFDVPRDCEFVPVHPFHTQCTSKEQACKVLEEAAEVFGAWQRVDDADRNFTFLDEDSNWHLPDLADEIADVIQAACNLAYRYGIDVAAAMQRCEARNRERGRYD